MSASRDRAQADASAAADRVWMLQAVEQGALGGKATRPNPRVGCVLVANGDVVGVGHHARLGGPHAEIVALQAAGDLARGATAYVTLEPCAHQGRTPPCADALIEAGIARVVIGVADPNPLAGGGAARLRAAGVAVQVGVAAASATRLAEVFLVNQALKRPFVRLKMAASLDGQVAARDGSTRWISGPAAREMVHRWRGQADAVLVGSGTALADDPRLDLRHGVQGPAPLRVVLDRRLRLSPDCRLADVSEQPTVVFCDPASAESHSSVRLRRRGVQVQAIDAPDGASATWLRHMLQALLTRGVHEVLVEGGPTLAASLWNAALVDRLELFMAPKLLGAGQPVWPDLAVNSLDEALRLQFDEVRPLGEDIYLSARPLTS